jgi:ligand-binding sensor domain-containing protein/signal transduction histidine kinase
MLCGLLLASACALVLAAGPRSLRFERIGLEEGLSQESVLAILQDHDGYMWFGTQAGLNRFDGYRNQVFRNDPNDPTSLADNYVQAAYEDGRNRLWFGTRGGLARFDPLTRKFVRLTLVAGTERNARNSAVTAIVGDGAAGLWVGTSDGIVHVDLDTGRIRTLRHDGQDPGSLRDDRVTALALDPRGGLWIGTGVGLDHLPAGAARFEHFDIDPAGNANGNGNGKRNAVAALSMGPRDTLWIGTDAGLEAWRIGQGPPQRHHLGADEGMNDGRVQSLYHDQGNTLWVGTELDGLKWRDPTTGRFVGYVSQPLDRHTLSDNRVMSIWVDRTGTLWAGTMFGGANRADLASGGFSRFALLPGQVADPRSARKIRSIAVGADGRLWLGTTGGGILHLDQDSGRVDTLRHDPRDPASLPDDTITSVLPGRGRLWVGSPSGLSWRDPATGRFTSVPLGREAGASWVQALALDHAGALWIVTRGGLFMLAPDGTLRGWRHDPLDPASLGENYGFAVFEDRAGAIWIGTENGLDRYDRATNMFTHFRHDPRDPTSLGHSRIYYLYESARGDLWVGTAGGLHRMERGPGGKTVFRRFAVAPTREQVPIGGILEDGSGQIWASTTVGLTRVDPETGGFKSYGANDGLTDGSYFVGSAARGADGELHFGGINGMTSFQPEDIHDNPFPPAVVITDFLVFNRPRALPGAINRLREIRLSHRDSVFTLEFAALHYADPQANRYAYRLLGFDQDWTETDARKRFATYTNLDPGEYVFEVKAANKDGVWSEHPATLAISIPPPFWMTWWFRLFGASVLAASAVALYRLRVRVLVQQKARLERQVGSRTAELVLQKEQAEAQKEAVEQARRNIALLSDIGRELTANLDGEAIMANVFGQVRQLMDAPLFAIGMARPNGPIEYPYVVADGRRVPEAGRFPARVRGLGDYCLATGEEILVGDLARDYARFTGLVRNVLGVDPAGTDADAPPSPRSLMFVPILVGSRVLGVITVQSGRPGAYQNVQLDMLSTLASYVGVALDNADAYRQLKETQAQLAAREKLASLGSLVAGVAHELNTPIGNSLLMASTLEEKTHALADRFAHNTLKKSDLETWIAAAREAASLIVRSLNGAADLVNSFKQVSVDQASTQRRRFDLGQACHEIAATMMNQVRRAGHTLDLQVPAGIVMDSYPGPFGQIVINFINNALLHGFDAPGGHMRLVATPLDGERVRIEFADDGRGIAPEHLSRIFDPFFTTRMGQGGTGLGLNIAYNLVTTLLQGTIRVESRPGHGTVFIIELPLRV